ncbi:hypothetical protein EU537_09310 [Candidatus Thorarchaeota archaeon]|nr:MAG: hypothetical protein EU537_09310 [Candidatus Thorarchaeota archaeon]
MDNEKKDNYIEMEFEIGDIEFEARGRSDAVERMFQLLIEKLESGGLVATLEIPDEDEWEDESWEEDEEDWEEDQEEIDEWEESEELEDEWSEEEDSYDYEEEESYDNDDSLESDAEEEEYTSEKVDDEEIPREAYLEPPPDWESLEEDTPPISESELESDELKRDL